MRRWLLICAAALGGLLLQPLALVAGEDKAQPQPLSFKLYYTDPATYMKGNSVKGTMEVIGGNRIISPKIPPYKLEMTCDHLQGTDLLNSTATSVTATKNVKFTTISMPKNPVDAASGKKAWPSRCDGAAELVVYNTAIDPSSKTVVHFLRIKRAKDSNGHDVPPKLVMTQPGKPGDVPVIVNATNEIDYNTDTGEYSLDQPTIETNDKENP